MHSIILNPKDWLISNQAKPVFWHTIIFQQKPFLFLLLFVRFCCHFYWICINLFNFEFQKPIGILSSWNNLYFQLLSSLFFKFFHSLLNLGYRLINNKVMKGFLINLCICKNIWNSSRVCCFIIFSKIITKDCFNKRKCMRWIIRFDYFIKTVPPSFLHGQSLLISFKNGSLISPLIIFDLFQQLKIFQLFVFRLRLFFLFKCFIILWILEPAKKYGLKSFFSFLLVSLLFFFFLSLFLLFLLSLLFALLFCHEVLIVVNEIKLDSFEKRFFSLRFFSWWEYVLTRFGNADCIETIIFDIVKNDDIQLWLFRWVTDLRLLTESLIKWSYRVIFFDYWLFLFSLIIFRRQLMEIFNFNFGSGMKCRGQLKIYVNGFI